MKKYFFLAAIAVLALASCSNDETTAVNNSSGEISFRPLMTGVTRAVDTQFDKVSTTNQFKVTAFRTGTSTVYFSNVAFKGDGSSFWVSDGTKYYWPEGYNLDFYAYAPISSAQISPDNTDGYKKFTVTPSSTVAEQVDLVYANTNKWGKFYEDGYHNGATGVSINFRHAGAKICIKVKNSSDYLVFEVSGLKVANVDGEAIFTYNTPDGQSAIDGSTDGSGTLKKEDWTNNADNQTIKYSTTLGTYTNTVNYSQTTPVWLNSKGASLITDAANMDQDINMILIPQTTTAVPVSGGYSATTANATITTGSYLALKMVVKDRQANVIATATADNKWAIWPVAFNWEPGKIYTYTIDLAGGGYWESNISGGDADLDPILDGAEIKFVTVSVDSWSDGGTTSVP